MQWATRTGRSSADASCRDTATRPRRAWTPTVAAFAGWKTTAWADRAASRDLYDLWLLAERDALTAEAAALYQRLGATNRPPTTALFTRAPDEQVWTRELSAQTRLNVTAHAALARVRAAWQRAAAG
ncbi:MAG: nucleotidyl transferase AbiEii/AbiGii toxin family protein [Thermocrispum sp.]